jgi:tetratricopeptide (TPR) repeat protein
MNGNIVIASAIVFCLSTLAAAQTADKSPSGQSPVEQELIALDKKLHDAGAKGDTALLSDVLNDNYVQVLGTGLRTKADVLKSTASAKPLPPSLEQPPAPTYTVRLHGDTAIMTHVTRYTDPHEPRPSVALMHVFVKQQERWTVAGSSSVPAAPSTEHSINRAGYELMQNGKTKEAIELFKLNVQLHPQSWNVYDSLGEAYAATGDKAPAMQNYEKSIQLNPNNGPGKAALAKLKGQ